MVAQVVEHVKQRARNRVMAVAEEPLQLHRWMEAEIPAKGLLAEVAAGVAEAEQSMTSQLWLVIAATETCWSSQVLRGFATMFDAVEMRLSGHAPMVESVVVGLYRCSKTAAERHLRQARYWTVDLAEKTSGDLLASFDELVAKQGL